MNTQSRRGFLADVGRGMLVASLGSAVACDLGLSHARAADASERLEFGDLEPLVGLLQDTPADKLQPLLIEKLKRGESDLRKLTCAAALANARAFGGQDYTGYHTLMALAPALQMSQELPEAQRALPVLKVIYRNATRIQEQGGRAKEVLHPLAGDRHAEPPMTESLRDATRAGDFNKAEQTLANSLTSLTKEDAFDQLQWAIQDDIDVHRVVLSWRAWALLDITGSQHALTLLRQSVRFCVQSEKDLEKYKRRPSDVRTTLPKLLDQYHLVGRRLGERKPDDSWVEKLAATICDSDRATAADAVAAALAEGFSAESIGEAISLAANQLVLRDPGRERDEEKKPKGSIHGASVGVHASDSANAWRNIARVSTPRNTVASLIVGAYHTAGQTHGLNKRPYPQSDVAESIRATDSTALLSATDVAIKEKDQARACALIHKYGTLNHDPRPVFDLLLQYAVSEDGALHAEKYYRTVTEEFATTRPAFRWRHLAALARVTASEYGWPAPGVEDAKKSLNV